MKTLSKLLIATFISGFSGFMITGCDSGHKLAGPSGNGAQVALQLVFPGTNSSGGLKKTNSINEVTVSVVDLETVDLLARERSDKPVILIKEQALNIEGGFAQGDLYIPVTNETQTFRIIVFASDAQNLLFYSGSSEIELERDQAEAEEVAILMGRAVSITSEGTAQASSTYPGDFAATRGQDLDFGTSWFSAGASADPEGSVYTWNMPQGAALEQRFIGTMGVFNNSMHDNPEYRDGFGFEQVNYKVFSGPDATGDLLFDETIDYPKTSEVPVLRVSPMVFGQSVQLTLTGHESPECGGFSELLIVNPLIPGPEIENAVFVSSTPPGATIYLDGANMNLTTPAILTGVEPGSHTLRLFLTGYNEYSEAFVLASNSTYTVDVTLTQPVPPIPVFTISQPENGAIFNDNVITVSGSIQLRAPDGTLSAFNGTQAVLTLNGVDKEIFVDNGAFFETVSIAAGENTIFLRANGPNGDTGVSDVLTVLGEFETPDIEITLTWNTPTADLDLHVWNPDGEHAYYSNQVISDGSLDIDDVDGFGPETFTAQNALTGTYIVKVNSFNLDADSTSDATIQIQLNGGQPQTFGPHRFTVDDGNGQNPEAWWDVTMFTMERGQRQLEIKPVSPATARKITQDIQNLKAKK